MNGQSFVTGSLVGDLRACANGLDLYASAADRIVELEAALAGLIDDEPCWYDHHGYCQAHFITSPCEMAIARTALSP